MQEPPQSTPLSSPFIMLSEHDVRAGGHAVQEPPQSTPLSSPFIMRSEHD
eukprot:COSAG01_NODE_4553_length_4929_cov_16.517805_5_plen_49_part_01